MKSNANQPPFRKQSLLEELDLLHALLKAVWQWSTRDLPLNTTSYSHLTVGPHPHSPVFLDEDDVHTVIRTAAIVKDLVFTINSSFTPSERFCAA